MKIIDADSVLPKLWLKMADKLMDMKSFEEIYQSLVEDLPSLQIEVVKHGKWIPVGWQGQNKEEVTIWKCSVCEHKAFIKTKHCTECGARMDLEED